MRVRYYRAASGREPVREYVDSLPIRDQAAIDDVLGAVREHGFDAPGVRFRRIRGKLWEIKIQAGAGHRIFYVMVEGLVMLLLHAYKKEGQKAPPREVWVAEARMKEVLHGS